MPHPTAAVITVSDSCFAGRKTDVSGPAVAARLAELGYDVQNARVVADERAEISAALRDASIAARLIVTTGGTGIAARDVTPEATRDVCEKLLDGVSERMRAEGSRQNPLAPLSRAVCGTLGRSLVLNLPGSPAGAVASLDVVADLLPHALDLLAGRTAHGEVRE